MPIKAPGRRINPTIRRKSGTQKKSVMAGLFLTSMVDMFAILTIFLLQSFSGEGELIVLPPGLQLPEARNVGTLEPAASLVISESVISFQGEVVAETAALLNDGPWVIDRLQQVLKEYRAKLETTAAIDGSEKKIEKINISADRRLPFLVVKKVIYNAGSAGFPDFRFAVFPTGTPDQPQN